MEKSLSPKNYVEKRKSKLKLQRLRPFVIHPQVLNDDGWRRKIDARVGFTSSLQLWCKIYVEERGGSGWRVSPIAMSAK
jgi:hypothetical protein